MPISGGALEQRAHELAERREAFVRATVVRAQRPTSAHAGDTALLHADGRLDGFVGGACVEASVREYGLRALSAREPLLLRVVAGEPSHRTEDGAVEVSNPCLSGGAVEIFLEPSVPAPRVVVVGATPVARALAVLGAGLGLEMEVVDGAATAPLPDDGGLIVASHGHDEEPSLEAALRAGVPYVALVASAERGTAVVASLNVDDGLRSRVFSPAGLDLGARTPAEVALSILAQLIAERTRQRSAGTAASVAVARATTAIDPVCGMSVAAVDATPQVDRDGVLTYFCSTGCRAAFLADPERYAAHA
ncbi:YHS domain-containing protein [Cryobacterium algoritolerans]|uniref:YHS domain-containing protein n=1 Tax=Cryobacterium algoritolerans TaxID=1259184 RepID=A0A4R8WLG1_9MICO|nr:XdhC family protein [Cryobacterium algoritolerans]TFC12229.1 YHS domain-containing protein [Cryobacterium algoritolerans]